MRIVEFLVCCLLLLISSFPCDASPGKLIVFAGISGSGKSSTAKALSSLLNVPCFLEPEEKDWPPYVRNKAPFGEFSAFTVFRTMRISALWQAWQLRNEGQVVIVDSYYDKITGYYLGRPGMEWLIDPADPYFACAQHICSLDTELLPDADCIVLMDISFEDWIKMLNSRGRMRDSIDGFRENYELYKGYIRNAVDQLCASRNIKLVVFKQQFSDAHTQSMLLRDLLIHENIINFDGINLCYLQNRPGAPMQ